jgi:hypothetical protein
MRHLGNNFNVICILLWYSVLPYLYDRIHYSSYFPTPWTVVHAVTHHLISPPSARPKSTPRNAAPTPISTTMTQISVVFAVPMWSRRSLSHKHMPSIPRCLRKLGALREAPDLTFFVVIGVAVAVKTPVSGTVVVGIAYADLLGDDDLEELYGTLMGDGLGDQIPAFTNPSPRWMASNWSSVRVDRSRIQHIDAGICEILFLCTMESGIPSVL